MKKLSLLLLAFSMVLLAASGAWAVPATFNDVTSTPPYTQAEEWASGQGAGYFGSGTYVDIIGNRFATQKIQISVSPYTIQIWTNNQPGGWTISGETFGIADIALDQSTGTASYQAYTTNHFGAITSPYEMGIDMSAYRAGTPGQGGSGQVTLMNVTTWKTSWDRVNPLGGGWTYGGAYKQSNQAAGTERQPAEVRILAGSSTGVVGTISWVLDGNTGPGGYPEYLITITFPTLGDLIQPYELLWSTSECANDIVEGRVPVPPTVLLLGSGLVGLALIGRRKLRKLS
jgi:hypothetical protein